MDRPTFFSFFLWHLLIGVLCGCVARLSLAMTGNINTAILCFYVLFIPLALGVAVIYDKKNELYQKKVDRELNNE